MEEFLKFFDKNVESCPMHLEISYNKTFDWEVQIYKKGCSGDHKYRDCESNGADVIIFIESNCDPEYLFAKAHVALKDWLIDYEGGYVK